MWPAEYIQKRLSFQNENLKVILFLARKNKSASISDPNHIIYYKSYFTSKILSLFFIIVLGYR